MMVNLANNQKLSYRDFWEYVAMELIKEVWKPIQESGQKITPSFLAKLRDEWRNKNGEVLDFSRMTPSPTDFENLLKSTGAKTFGRFDGKSGEALQAELKKFVSEKWKEFNTRRKNGEFIHVYTDPVVRRYILNNKNFGVATFMHRGKSLSELSAGESSVIYNEKGDKELLSFTVAGISQTKSLKPSQPSGFTQQSQQNPITPSQPNGFTQQSQQNPIAPTSVKQEVQQTQVDADVEIADGEQFLGWEGGEKDGVKYRGLKDVLGAYFTKADNSALQKRFSDDQTLYNSHVVQSSLTLLKHLRSNGYDFNVKDATDAGSKHQIEVRLANANDLSVRVFDSSNNGKYIGRLYDAFNVYYYYIKATRDVQEKIQIPVEDSIAILDFMMGKRTGEVRKAKSTSSTMVLLDGLKPAVHNGRKYTKWLMVKPSNDTKKGIEKKMSDPYRVMTFPSVEDAENFIRTAIADAKELVETEFHLEEIQALIDKALDSQYDENVSEDDVILLTGEKFAEMVEPYLSKNNIIRMVQEEMILNAYHSDDGGREKAEQLMNSIVGDYENGFNPNFVVDHMKPSGLGNERDAMITALKMVDYDVDKLQGNEFGVNNIRERLVKFDPETAVGMAHVKHPMLKKALQSVRDTLYENRLKNIDVKIDEQGIIYWEADRIERGMDDKNNNTVKTQRISGEIGQVFVPDENGIIKTKFNHEGNYGFVPGYTGYFTFEGSYENRMERFRVKGFEQHLIEQLKAKVTHQVLRPLNKHTNNIPTILDSTALNKLYHGQMYGKRIDPDFMETSQLDEETKRAILKTLSNRVRFDNQFSDFATTRAETLYKNNENAPENEDGSFDYWKLAGETNMRVIGKELPEDSNRVDVENYVDLIMTGTGKTQGLIWYLTDGAKVNEDGSVTPSKGLIDEKGNKIPDTTALRKLPYFKYEKFSAWDRNQMSSNQLMTALHVDKGVNVALMSFGGWTFDDSYAVSKEFAERNKIFGEEPNDESMRVLEDAIRHTRNGSFKTDKDKQLFFNQHRMRWTDEVITQGVALQERIDELSLDRSQEARSALERARQEYRAFLEEHGRFRPLQRGDKISDFGGNKGTIGIVIDRNMSDDEAKRLKLEKEVKFFRANPELDVVSAPYSMLSRHNAGVVKEMMESGPKDLVDPDTGEVYKSAMGKLNIIVTDMAVDKKTHAYTQEDIAEGKGRKASGQLAWALQSKGAKAIMGEIYGNNVGAWETFREYLIVTGLDMQPDGTIKKGYHAHHGEERVHFAYHPEKTSEDFLKEIYDAGGFLDLPFELKFKTGESTNELPVLSASLRQNVELIDGTMRRSDFTKNYAKIYDEVRRYMELEAKKSVATPKELAEIEQTQKRSIENAQRNFDQIQSEIIERQFNGTFNGKHSFIRDKIMGKRMMNSATGVAIADPRLDIGDAGMNSKMMEALGVKEGDYVMVWRDPVWRDGAIRAMRVVHDETAHGIAVNPIVDKSHDMDFDGDTMGVIALKTKSAQNELKRLFSHQANLIDLGPGTDELYFQSGMDLASALAKAEELGDKKPMELYKSAHEKATSGDSKLYRQALKDLNKYAHLCFRKYSFGADWISLENDEAVFESFKRIVDHKAKGAGEKGMKRLEGYKQYHRGEKTMKDAREVQYATGVKSDDTGLAGTFSQKLVSVLRNHDIKAVLEAMYPITQGTLQIKHDADQAKIVNDLLANKLTRLFKGYDTTEGSPKDKKVTPKEFKQQFTDIMSNEMGVEIDEKWIDIITEGLTENGRFLPLEEAMSKKGSPMDRVAYGGGYQELIRLAEKGESLLEGEQNAMFAPYVMRNAEKSRDSVIAKKDTQRKVAQEYTQSLASQTQEVELEVG